MNDKIDKLYTKLYKEITLIMELVNQPNNLIIADLTKLKQRLFKLQLRARQFDKYRNKFDDLLEQNSFILKNTNTEKVCASDIVYNKANRVKAKKIRERSLTESDYWEIFFFHEEFRKKEQAFFLQLGKDIGLLDESATYKCLKKHFNYLANNTSNDSSEKRFFDNYDELIDVIMDLKDLDEIDYQIICEDYDDDLIRVAVEYGLIDDSDFYS